MDCTGPYFTYATKVGITTDRDPPMPTLNVDVPQCIAKAYLHLANMAEWYAQHGRPWFDQIFVLAWTASGTRKKVSFPRRSISRSCLAECVVENVVCKEDTSRYPLPRRGSDTEPCAEGVVSQRGSSCFSFSCYFWGSGSWCGVGFPSSG